jgi:hypothetical protein
MFSYSLFLGLLTVFIFFIEFFCFSPASASIFVAVFIVLEAARSLASWLAIAIFFYVWEKFDFSRSEGRVISDLRFLFKVLISYEFRR